MKYTPLYNLIIRGYHKSWVIIRVSIYKPRGVALTFASLIPPSPTPCISFLPTFSLCSSILPVFSFFSTMLRKGSAVPKYMRVMAFHDARKTLLEIRPIGLISLREPHFREARMICCWNVCIYDKSWSDKYRHNVLRKSRNERLLVENIAMLIIFNAIYCYEYT